MSLDLFERESEQHIARLSPAKTPEVGIWDGFTRGSAMHTMRGLARTGRAIDVLGSVGPIVEDAFTGGTEAQDRYFREHDEVWGRAVESWTPDHREVGAAAEVVGMLASTLPMVLAAPSLAVGSMQLSLAEDLINQGVDPSTAQTVGAAQAIGLGLGIYVPIFGQTLAQRVLYGGVGFNLLQGIGMRTAGAKLLEATPAEGQFRIFDPLDMTLDVILGAAFGGIVHLSPAQRAHGARVWQQMEAWSKGLTSAELDALTVMRQAQHLSVDSMPGKPREPVDIERHAARTKQALEQLVRGEQVEVSDLPAPRFEPDEARQQESEANIRTLAESAEEVRVSEGLAEPPPVIEIEWGRNLTPDQSAAELRARAQITNDLEGNVAAYKALPGAENGKVLNVDEARELFPDYVADRSGHSASVHEPASALIKELYRRALTTPDSSGMNLFLFMAGGTGAGKTTALGSVPTASKVRQSAQLVYDTNMANARSGIVKIQDALNHGKKVVIVHVGATVEQGFERMLERASRMETEKGSGRAVPFAEHINTHRGSGEAMITMQQHFAGTDEVQFIFLDNSSGVRGEVGIVEPADSVPYLRAQNFDNLEARLLEVLDGEKQAGRISERIYRGVKSASPAGVGEASGRGATPEPGEGLAREPGAAPAREETDARVRPKAGAPIIVYRLGRGSELTNRNASNTHSLGLFLERVDDVDRPQPVGGTGDTITAYEVISDTGFGQYTTFDRGSPKTKRALDRAGRRATGMDSRGIEYSFPEGAGWTARPVASASLEEVRNALGQLNQYRTFDQAGAALATQAVRQVMEPRIAESRAPAAPRGEAASPPPRSSRRGEVAGAEDQVSGPRPAGVEGKTGRAITERGTEVEVQFRVVEVENLITSHDDALVRRADYPAEIQPRERGRAASEAQITSIENNIRPELLGENPKASDGAPVVGPDGVVESGNARTIALRRAYRGAKAEKYKAWLLERAEEFGLNRADVEAMREPMLVRERQTDVDRAAFAREANEAAVAQMSPVEVARADVARMPELDRLVASEDGTINIRASMEFIRDFIESVPPTERPALMTADGALSQMGLARIRNAVFQKAYGDPELSAMMAESTDANIRNILAGMLRAAPEVAKVRELVDTGTRYPTTFPEDLAEAVRLYSQIRADGMTVQNYLSQGQMFDGEIQPGVARLLTTLDQNSRAPRRLAEAIQGELDVVHGRGNPRQVGLFEKEDGVLEAEAQRVASEQPDTLLRVGETADGEPVLKTMREFLDDAVADAETAREHAGLFEVAAGCLLKAA